MDRAAKREATLDVRTKIAVTQPEEPNLELSPVSHEAREVVLAVDAKDGVAAANLVRDLGREEWRFCKVLVVRETLSHPRNVWREARSCDGEGSSGSHEGGGEEREAKDTSTHLPGEHTTFGGIRHALALGCPEPGRR